MIPLFMKNRTFFIFVPAGILLAGCLSIGNTETRFYVLNPIDTGTSLVAESEEKGKLSVEVASLRLPQYLEKPQIVIRTSVNRLELEEFHQWGGNLRKNMTRVLAKNLSHLLATPNIAISPYRPPTPPDFRIEFEVMQFERGPDAKVHFSVQWRLSSGKEHKALTTQITDLSSPEVSIKPDFEHTVSEMSALIGELSKIIGEEILKHKHRMSEL